MDEIADKLKEIVQTMGSLHSLYGRGRSGCHFETAFGLRF